jgi:hypothetical protein
MVMAVEADISPRRHPPAPHAPAAWSLEQRPVRARLFTYARRG